MRSYLIYLFCTVLIATAVNATLPKLIFGTTTDPAILQEEAWLGRKAYVVQRWGGFCDDSWYSWLFSDFLGNWNAGRVTQYTLSPRVFTDCTSNYVDPSDPNQYILDGHWNSSITAFNARLKIFLAGPDMVLGNSDDRRIYIRLAHELNGNWYTWSANSATFKQMWVYVWTRIMSAGFNKNHIQWIFEPVGPYEADAAHDFRNYWPGDQYVDWLSLDAYNFAQSQAQTQTWQSPSEIFDFAMYKLRDWRPQLPLMISETGCASYNFGSVGVARKNQWLPALYQYLAGQNVQQVLYFNTFDGTGDFAVFQPQSSLQAPSSYVGSDGVTYGVFDGYKSASQSLSYQLTNPTSARIMSDDEFLGHLPGWQTKPARPSNQVIYSNGAAYYDWKPTPAPYPLNIKDSTRVRPGSSYSLSLDLAPWGNVQLQHTHRGFNSSNYNALQFWMNTVQSNVAISVRAYTSDGGYHEYSGIVVNGPTAGTWAQIVLNWSQLSIPLGVLVQGFYILGYSNNDQGNAYFDQIELVSNEMNWPSNWPPVSTSAPTSAPTPKVSTPIPTPKPTSTPIPTPKPTSTPNATPAPTLQPSSGNYLGCFVDSLTRDVNGLNYNDSSMTIDLCRHYCGVRRFPYAALQSGIECRCGNSYGSQGSAPDLDCSMACSGNATQKCGARFRNSIYKSDYLGCYLDSETRDLRERVSYDAQITVEKCIPMCASAGYLYAGLQYSTECWCGNSYGSQGKAGSDGECNMPCGGNQQEMCGSGYRNSIYQVHKLQ